MKRAILVLAALVGCGGEEEGLVECTPGEPLLLCEAECARATQGDPNQRCTATSATTGDTIECTSVSEADGIRGCCDISDEDPPSRIVFYWFECEGQ